MILSEREAKRDKSVKDFVDLSHEELLLPEIDDMSEYASIGNDAYKGASFEEVQKAFDFIERQINEHAERKSNS